MICPHCQFQFEPQGWALLYECPKCRGVFDSVVQRPSATATPAYFGEVTDAKKPAPGTAALIEAIGGVFQVFGLGHLYAGRIGVGLFVMFAYWIVQAVNVLLAFAVIGFVTAPLCWMLAMFVCVLSASRV